ncbi:MAG: phage holin family protein [Limisphaerales bacterium]
MKRFLHSWVINTLAVLVAVCLLRPRINYAGLADLLVASLLLGVLNAVLRPILMLLTFPILIVTLGLFRFVINALLLLLVGYLLRPHFSVEGFWAAFWGALIISLVSSILNVLTGSRRVRFRRLRRPPGSGDDGSGPVIDV